jgi:hypothetical protein
MLVGGEHKVKCFWIFFFNIASVQGTTSLLFTSISQFKKEINIKTREGK